MYTFVSVLWGCFGLSMECQFDLCDVRDVLWNLLPSDAIKVKVICFFYRQFQQSKQG